MAPACAGPSLSLYSADLLNTGSKRAEGVEVTHGFDRHERGRTAWRSPSRRYGGAPASAARRLGTARLVACVAVGALALSGCGENTAKSASASSVATTASTPTTTPSTPTTPKTTSTATKSPPAKPAKQSTTPTTTSTAPTKPPAAKTSSKSGKPAKQEPVFGKVRLTSTAFKTGGPIPVKYTCDGASISPPLEWGSVPRGTNEIMILAIDLSGSASDAIQWAVAGIQPSANSIPEGRLPAGAVAGVNSEGKTGWGGICGTKGQLHRVGFLFYALKHPLGLKSGFNPIQVRGGLKGSILGTGLTLATYKRPS
jgi:phosphatidylethanolamine-binding protein (PEBP) family uncharacterized protein